MKAAALLAALTLTSSQVLAGNWIQATYDDASCSTRATYLMSMTGQQDDEVCNTMSNPRCDKNPSGAAQSMMRVCSYNDPKTFIHDSPTNYVFATHYSDNTCSKEVAKTFTLMNTCIQLGDGYVKANCNEFLKCSDSACTQCISKPNWSGNAGKCLADDESPGVFYSFMCASNSPNTQTVASASFVSEKRQEETTTPKENSAVDRGAATALIGMSALLAVVLL